MKRKNLFVSCGRALLFSLILLGFGVTKSQAQVSYYAGISGGPQYTFLVSNMGEYNPRVGFFGGLTQEIQFGQMFSVQLDAFYSQKGANREHKDSLAGFYDQIRHINIKRTEKLNYAEGQLLFKLNLPIGRERIIPYERPGKTAAVTIFAGPYFGYLLNYSSTGYSDTAAVALANPDSVLFTSRDNASYDFDSYRKVKRVDPLFGTDLGIVLGAGMNFLVGERGMFAFDLRYSRGIASIDNNAYSRRRLDISDVNNPRFRTTNAEVFNQAIALNIGFKYRLLGRGINRNF